MWKNKKVRNLFIDGEFDGGYELCELVGEAPFIYETSVVRLGEFATLEELRAFVMTMPDEYLRVTCQDQCDDVYFRRGKLSHIIGYSDAWTPHHVHQDVYTFWAGRERNLSKRRDPRQVERERDIWRPTPFEVYGMDGLL